MEYLKTHNYFHAQQYLNQAKISAQKDPIVFNEIGVSFYQNNEFVV